MNVIEKQYQTAKNLNTRISIHDKYSTNHQPFGEWIMSHYEIKPGYRILELGCGTGEKAERCQEEGKGISGSS